MTSASLRGRPGGFSNTSTGRPGVVERFKRVTQYRRILGLLVRRDLKVRYAGSALGYLWTVLDPLLMSLVFWFVFTDIFHRKVGYPPYILFLVIGQLMWAWFNGGVLATAKALRSETQMVRSSNVPRELWVLRTVLSKGVEFVFSLPVIAIFAIAYLKSPGIHILLLPLAMLLCFALVLGIGLILAPLTVLVRDVERIIPIVLRVLFYCSPILYSVKDVPKHLHTVLSVNPTTGMLVLARASFFPQELHWDYVWHSFVVTLVILAIGVFVFARLERPVLKEI